MGEVPVGQSVAAYVNLKNTQEWNWMLGTVVGYDKDIKQYIVEDSVEDEATNSKPMYTVQAEHIVSFPQRSTRFKRYEKVLAVWYETSTQSWTSILYPAQVIEKFPSTEIPESVVLKVRYDGDPKISYINALWAIKMPETAVNPE